jgi:CDGSH-type Zn-finger protein
MTEPEIARKAPYGVDLAPGTYGWCACGRSQHQPFCDGSHPGTGLTPVRLDIEEARKVWLCGCKRSADRPFCDGTHSTL